MDYIKYRVLDALQKFEFYQFNEAQLQTITQIVIERKVLEDYERGFITDKEADNMILHIASELASTLPNKGAFIQPPNSSSG